MEMVTSRRSFGERMKGAAMLDTSVYEEVEHDSGATGQAAGVVAIVAVCAAIGGTGTGTVLGSALGAVLGWLVLAGIVYLVGDKLFGGTATWGEMLRTMGFAQSPGVLYLLGVIPLLGWVARVLVGIWILIAVIVGIRQGLDVGTGKAVLTGIVAWLGYAILMGTLSLAF